MPRTFSLALCIATVVACGGRSTDLPTEANDGGTDSSASDSDSALPPGVAFMQGSVKCCEQGLGQSCCTSDEKELGSCVEFRGCTHAGSGYGGKVYCAKCCDGLSLIARTKPVDGACKDDSFPDDGPICAACGNGVCDTTAGENPCNCPADCGPRP